LPREVTIMEKKYWLSRKRASGVMARRATSAEARLIHLELAGRYSIRAANCGPAELYLHVEGDADAAPAADGHEPGRPS
jgi:hypothetical protein